MQQLWLKDTDVHNCMYCRQFGEMVNSGGIDRQLVHEIQNGQKSDASGKRSNRAQLRKELEEWVQMQLKENQFSYLLAEQLDDHQKIRRK